MVNNTSQYSLLKQQRLNASRAGSRNCFQPNCTGRSDNVSFEQAGPKRFADGF